MRRYFFLPFLTLVLMWAASPSPVIAQTDTPPVDATGGVVLGKIINQNKGDPVTGSLDIMLHIWDQQYVDLGMEHGKSEADGTFKFSNVATLSFPLPTDADFIFFQPEGQDRFIKFSGGFADTYPLLPGESSEQFSVQYLLPFSSGRTYTYTAPVNAQAINFLLPADSGVTMEGQGLSNPQPYTLENGSSYQFYSHGSLRAGETIKVSFKGRPKVASSKTANNPTLPLALGGVILGLTMVGVGVWWWRRPDEQEIVDDGDETADLRTENYNFDTIVAQIVGLDEAYEQGLIEGPEHQRQRRELLLEAKKNFPEKFR